LSDYLNQGGSLLLMIDPNTKSTLSLQKIGVLSWIAIDPSGAGVGLGPAVPSY